MAIDAQLQALVERTEERLDAELKGWLDISTNNGHKGLLGKAAIALANHGGGFIILGFESNGTASVGRPANLDAFNQDAINGVINRYAEPPIHCSVHIVQRAATVSRIRSSSCRAGIRCQSAQITEALGTRSSKTSAT